MSSFLAVLAMSSFLAVLFCMRALASHDEYQTEADQPYEIEVDQPDEAELHASLIQEPKSTSSPASLPTHFLHISSDSVCKQMFFFTDIEGTWKFWEEMTSSSTAFAKERDGSGNLVLADGACIVYGGDTLDSAGKDAGKMDLQPIKVTYDLVTLSEKYPTRVILILGNRDLNKLRLKAELMDAADPDDFPYYWLPKQDENLTQAKKRCEKSPPAIGHCSPQPGWKKNEAIGSKLRKIMAESMGAWMSLDAFKEEMKMNDDEMALHIRDTLLAPDGIWYRYLEKGVMLGGAAFNLPEDTDQSYAVFSHSGVHPLMFKDDSFMVPGSEFDPFDGTLHYEDRGLPLDFSLPPQDRVPVRLDNYQRPVDGGFQRWTELYALWKQGVFSQWAEPLTDEMTGANRPGVTLMDGGLGNLAGIFRNAGFTTGGPCTAWEYGVNYRGYDSDTYEETSPEAFGDILKSFRIKYIFNGHFTEGGNKLPVVFPLGSSGVIVHNHDLSKGDFPLSYSTLSIDGEVKTFGHYPAIGTVPLLSPLAPGSLVGSSGIVPNSTCDELFLTGLAVWPGPAVDKTVADYVAYIQDQRVVDSATYVIKKINPKPTPFATQAWYCASKKEKEMEAKDAEQ